MHDEHPVEIASAPYGYAVRYTTQWMQWFFYAT